MPWLDRESVPHQGMLPCLPLQTLLMTTPIKWQVAPEGAGERLDRALAEHIPDLSRSYAASLIESGAVTVNGTQAIKTSQKLKVGDIVIVEIPPAQPSSVEAQEIPLDVVYEDADLLVVNKPAGMVVHPAP